MPQMSFDLMDGKPKVSFILKQEDVDRFMQFMNDCNGYMKQRDSALEQAQRLKRVLQESYDQRDEVMSALKELAALHEPEGRFQPHHFKAPVAKAYSLIAKIEVN